MTVLLVDYGMGNLGSAQRALERCGAQVIISDDPGAIAQAGRIVLPGVGAFPAAAAALRARGWDHAICAAVRENKMPLLGICLGMQLLSRESDEFGVTAGLALIDGRVERIVPQDARERVPHVGWNAVHSVGQSRLFAAIPDAADFYFVHSYRFVPAQRESIIATTDFAGETVAAVAQGQVFGVQFHPEKSAWAGLDLLRNFLGIGRG